MMNFTDTHCHLNLKAFEEDLPDVIKNAQDKNMMRVMIPGTDLPSSQRAIEISNTYPGYFAAIGVHPNDARKWTEETLDQLRILGQDNPKVLAIGEIGLDYYRDWSTPEQQKEILHLQLALAKELNLPVIIHIRETIEESFDILFDWQKALEKENHPLGKRPGVLHAFPGEIKDARLAIEHQFKIGVGGPVTFKSANKRRTMVKELPLTSILLETDAPFMAPVPKRGKRNEPAFIPYIAEKIAEVKGISLEEVSVITTENAKALFQW